MQRKELRWANWGYLWITWNPFWNRKYELLSLWFCLETNWIPMEWTSCKILQGSFRLLFRFFRPYCCFKYSFALDGFKSYIIIACKNNFDDIEHVFADSFIMHFWTKDFFGRQNRILPIILELEWCFIIYFFIYCSLSGNECVDQGKNWNIGIRTTIAATLRRR